MATSVIMPALGMDQEKGTLVRWIKHEGERVERGEPIMEVETDKVVVEIEATASGVLANVTAAEGDEIPVGHVIAQIIEEGGAPSPTPPPILGEGRATPVAPVAPVASSPPSGVRADSPQISALSPQSSRALASPRARRLAAERGVDLAAAWGSGPEGAVLATDVAAAPAQPSVLSPQSSPSSSRLWRTMAERMVASWTTAPHFFLVREVIASALVEMHGRVGPAAERRGGVRPTYTDLLVKLVGAALQREPRMNASWAGAGIRQHAEVNVGIATAVEEGLLVPVIHAADTLTLGEVAAKRRDLVDRAQSGRLRPEDVAGGTFTLSNLGMYNVDAFHAIVNPPQAGILAVGRLADRVVAIDGQPAVRPTLTLTLSCDHRAIDGARAARFLDELATLIEEPWGLLA